MLNTLPLSKRVFDDVRARIRIRISPHFRGARRLLRLFGARRLGCAVPHRARDRLYRIRLHRAEHAYRKSGAADDAPPPATGRTQADSINGRRHHETRRPIGKGRSAKASFDRADRSQQELHAGRNPSPPEIRRRTVGCHHGRQRRLAGQTRLHSLSARSRTAFFRQQNADDGERSNANRRSRSSNSIT